MNMIMSTIYVYRALIEWLGGEKINVPRKGKKNFSRSNVQLIIYSVRILGFNLTFVSMKSNTANGKNGEKKDREQNFK